MFQSQFISAYVSLLLLCPHIDTASKKKILEILMENCDSNQNNITTYTQIYLTYAYFLTWINLFKIDFFM